MAGAAATVFVAPATMQPMLAGGAAVARTWAAEGGTAAPPSLLLRRDDGLVSLHGLQGASSSSTLPTGATSGLAVAGGAAAAFLLFGRRSARRSRQERRHALRGVVAAIKAGASRVRSVGVARRATEAATDTVSEEEVREIFNVVSRGKKRVTLEDALELEGIDGIVEEQAVTIEELESLWGEEPLDFKGFSNWYKEVLELYDEYLASAGLAPPSELMDEVVGVQESREEGGPRKIWDDDELIEDATAKEDISDIIADAEEDRRRMAEGDNEGAQEAEKEAVEKRGNAEIAQLFREGCREDNLLAFQGLKEVSDIADMLAEGDITERELKELWGGASKTGGDAIDILAFRDLMAKVDALFDYDDDEDDEAKPSLEGGGDIIASSSSSKPVSAGRSVEELKAELLSSIDKLLLNEDKDFGLGGNAETDPDVTKYCIQLEDAWRATLDDDMSTFQQEDIAGEWELLYTTSAKLRRWGSVLNSGREVKNGQLVTLVERYAYDDKKLSPEYDIEELFETKDGDELGMRASGSWNVGLQTNVVTAADDLRVKIQLNGIEVDTPEGDARPANEKAFLGVSCRTYCYSFLAYLDKDLRIMRTGLTGDLVFIYRRLEDDDDDDGSDWKVQ
eukprot:TRINITY_DN41318_c0_g1_i1.p1 TRINITY_DN41318_c0_g1~~TRINITY_DN41318_c0_g1_i1.p1  ORF type:complete len:622 (+),score=220.68 TRINITY_DN41318_c0_g1_i1:75-1940(+)